MRVTAISGRWNGDTEKLYAVKPRFPLQNGYFDETTQELQKRAKHNNNQYNIKAGNCHERKALTFKRLHGPSMLPDKAKFVVCSIISLTLSFMKHLVIWMKHLVIGQLQKPATFSAFHWSTSRSQAFIGQLLGTSRVVHLPKRTVMVLFTISDA